ncbi:MAG: DUF2203 domain-containing protein [Fuerstiella sp.]|nr:DUF2203 domain-containing protein [Fuerstiella sp.]
MSQPAVFSTDAANKRLPYVQTVVRDIVALARDLQERQERLSEIGHLREQSDGDFPSSEELEQMVQSVEHDFARFDELEKELNLIQVNVVDRNSGLVEMASQLDDQLIWINWQPGEAEFMFWRSNDDDSMMRRPLLESVAGRHGELSERMDTDR